jgi:hypothetical protein
VDHRRAGCRRQRPAQPQLIAVTDDVNQDKSDLDPAEWMPPVTDDHCAYAVWVEVKYHWNLTVDEQEKTALADTLTSC